VSYPSYPGLATYSQICVDEHVCQKTLCYVDSNYDNNRLQHVIGIGAENIMVADGRAIAAADTLSVTAHPAWSQISVFDVPSKGKAPFFPSGDPAKEKCLEADRMFSNEIMPAGSFMPWFLMEPDYATVSSKYYITIGSWLSLFS
jgi:hypothetical protein